MNFLVSIHNLLAQAASPSFTLPPGPALSLDRIMKEFLTPVANFLIAAGVIAGIITIVIAGIMYFRAGSSDVEVKKAKGWFRNGLIGAVIILGVGVIINSVAIFVTGEFTGFLPGGGGGPGPGGVAGGPGYPCITNDQCAKGTTCRLQTGICVRIDGNVEGDLCKNNGDCRQGLECKGGILGIGDKVCKQPKQKKTKPSPTATTQPGQTKTPIPPSTTTSCKLINVLTDKNKVNEGERIRIVVTGESKCNGKSITLEACGTIGCDFITKQNFEKSINYFWDIPKDFNDAYRRNDVVFVKIKAKVSADPLTRPVYSGDVEIRKVN